MGVWQGLAQGVPLQAHKGGIQQLRGHVPKLVVPQVQPGEQWEAGQAGGHGGQEVAVQNEEAQGAQPRCGAGAGLGPVSAARPRAPGR